MWPFFLISANLTGKEMKTYWGNLLSYIHSYVIWSWIIRPAIYFLNYYLLPFVYMLACILICYLVSCFECILLLFGLDMYVGFVYIAVRVTFVLFSNSWSINLTSLKTKVCIGHKMIELQLIQRNIWTKHEKREILVVRHWWGLPTGLLGYWHQFA